MGQPKQPDKQQVKDWLDERAEHRQPLPDQSEIRRKLGWPLSQNENGDRDGR